MHSISVTAPSASVQDERVETDPLAVSVQKLADLVYGDRSHLTSAAIPCALTGFGVRLYRDYVTELKVGAIAAFDALSMHPAPLRHGRLLGFDPGPSAARDSV